MADTKNVSVGKPLVGGAIYTALVTDGLSLPTDATTQMSTLTDFKSLGYISEDGVTNGNSPSTTDHKAWGGYTVANSVDEKADTFSWTMIECLNEEVLKTIYGSKNVTKDTSGKAITIKATNDEMENRAFVIDMILQGGAVKRIVIPNSVVTEIGDITYKDSDLIGYEITVSARPDGNASTHYEYIKEQ